MSKRIIAFATLAVCLCASAPALAQDSFSASAEASATASADQDMGSPLPIDSPPERAAAPAVDAGLEKEIIRGFLGPRLGVHYNVFLEIDEDGALAAAPDLAFTPQLEGGIWILDRFEVYLAFGALVYGVRLEDGDSVNAERAGAVLFQLGGRFHITEARPKHAFLYTGLDMTGIFGVSKLEQKDNGASVEGLSDREKANKELIDQWALGIQLGVEYLVTEEFGIGAESGIRIGYNKLKDIGDPKPDKARIGSFQIPFMLRFMYHF